MVSFYCRHRRKSGGAGGSGGAGDSFCSSAGNRFWKLLHYSLQIFRSEGTALLNEIFPNSSRDNGSQFGRKIPVPMNDAKLQGRNSGAVTNRKTSCGGGFSSEYVTILRSNNLYICYILCSLEICHCNTDAVNVCYDMGYKTDNILWPLILCECVAAGSLRWTESRQISWHLFQ